MSDFHGRILNLQIDQERAAFDERTVENISAYKAGHRAARHAAAEIALEADRMVTHIRRGEAALDAYFGGPQDAGEPRSDVFAAEALANGVETLLRERAEADRRLAAAKEMVTAIAAVESWMANESGPLFALWENAEIGSYEYEHGGDIDWPQTLANIRDLSCPEDQLGCDGAPVEVDIYRQIYELLMAAKEGR